jgi:hypothetical protein
MRRRPPQRAQTIRVTQADGTASWAEPLQVGRAAVYAGTCSWADAHFVKEGGFYPRPVDVKTRRPDGGP